MHNEYNRNLVVSVLCSMHIAADEINLSYAKILPKLVTPKPHVEQQSLCEVSNIRYRGWSRGCEMSIVAER